MKNNVPTNKKKCSLPSCSCEGCKQERQIQKSLYTPQSHVTLSFQSAYILGLIKTRNSYGSVARELAHK